MCTLSFSPTRTGLLLAMNRDESLARELALLPRIFRAGGRAAIYPSEPSGGTWLAVNERGLILALLNRNGAPELPKLRSRGALVPNLIYADSLDEVEGRLNQIGAAGMLPFTLLGVDSVAQAIVEVAWDGQALSAQRHSWTRRHWFSSSLSDQDAAAIRGRTCAVFHEHFAASPENVRELHRSHSPGAGPFSICVHRPGVASVSYSEIVIAGTFAAFSYAPGTPCKRGPMQTVSLRVAEKNLSVA
jgi:hypothetical protein